MIDRSLSSSGADAAMSVCDARLSAAVSGNKQGGGDAIEKSSADELEFSTQILAEEYPKFYSSMVNLIKNSENRIKSVCED